MQRVGHFTCVRTEWRSEWIITLSTINGLRFLSALEPLFSRLFDLPGSVPAFCCREKFPQEMQTRAGSCPGFVVAQGAVFPCFPSADLQGS